MAHFFPLKKKWQKPQSNREGGGLFTSQTLDISKKIVCHLLVAYHKKNFLGLHLFDSYPYTFFQVCFHHACVREQVPAERVGDAGRAAVCHILPVRSHRRLLLSPQVNQGGGASIIRPFSYQGAGVDPRYSNNLHIKKLKVNSFLPPKSVEGGGLGS